MFANCFWYKLLCALLIITLACLIIYTLSLRHPSSTSQLKNALNNIETQYMINIELINTVNTENMSQTGRAYTREIINTLLDNAETIRTKSIIRVSDRYSKGK